MDAAPITPRFRVALGVAVSAALLVPLAVYGAPAIAKSASSASHQYRAACGQYGSSGGQYGSSGGQYGSSCKQYRVQICHRTHSKKHPWHLITVSSRALKAHLRHGDTLAPCSTQPAAKEKHGKGHGEHGHGKHGDAGPKHDRD
jgi:hypothetical protein